MPVLATYKLEYPVEIEEADKNIKRYEEVKVLRRIKGKDMRSEAFQRIMAGEILVDDMFEIANRLCDVPSHVFDEMVANDIEGLFEALEPFLSKKDSRALKK